MTRESDLVRVGQTLKAAGKIMDARATLAWRLAREFAASPGGGGGGPSAKNAISDPTGNAASHPDKARGARAELERLVELLDDAVPQLMDLVVFLTGSFDSNGEPKRVLPARSPRSKTRSVCAEPWCEDESSSAPSRMGRCEPCFQFQYKRARKKTAESELVGRPHRWSIVELPCVPKEVIEARLAEREIKARREHVTGPLVQPTESVPAGQGEGP